MMAETVEKIAEYSANEIVGRVAAALEDAAKTYGPDAVDLALVAYRVQAIQGLLVGVACGAVLYAILAIRKRVASDILKEMGSDPWDAIGVHVSSAFIAAVPGVPMGVTALSHLADVPAWLATFGYPEILIATKALAAAGLM